MLGSRELRQALYVSLFIVASLLTGNATAYNPGNSVVVGGFSGAVTYYNFSNVRGACCGCWVYNNGSYTAAGSTYGSVSGSPVSGYFKTYTQNNCSGRDSGGLPDPSYLTVLANPKCPSNTAEIEVYDYMRADGIRMDGKSIVCVKTDNY